MAHFRTCPQCGANLDPGEVRGCAETSVHLTIWEAEKATGIYRKRYTPTFAPALIRASDVPMSRRAAHHCKGDLSYVLCKAQGRKDHN